MLDLLLVTIGIGSVTLYYMIKIISGNCNSNNPRLLSIEYDDEEVPPKYEDIVNIAEEI